MIHFDKDLSIGKRINEHFNVKVTVYILLTALNIGRQAQQSLVSVQMDPVGCGKKNKRIFKSANFLHT